MASGFARVWLKDPSTYPVMAAALTGLCFGTFAAQRYARKSPDVVFLSDKKGDVLRAKNDESRSSSSLNFHDHGVRKAALNASDKTILSNFNSMGVKLLYGSK